MYSTQLTKGHHFAQYMGLGFEEGVHRMTIDGEAIEAYFTDLSSTTLRIADANFSTELFIQSLSGAVGIVLLYDITSLVSFDHITEKSYAYACMCNNYMGEDAGERIREYILVGNKKDIVEKEPEKRQVDEELAAEWAQSQGMRHVELTTHDREDVEKAVHDLMRSILRAKRFAKKGKANVRAPGLKNHGDISTKSKIKQALGMRKNDT